MEAGNKSKSLYKMFSGYGTKQVANRIIVGFLIALLTLSETINEILYSRQLKRSSHGEKTKLEKSIVLINNLR